MGNQRSQVVRSVVAEAPARLHLGFIDLNGSLGRRFGSLGLALEGMSVRVRVREHSEFRTSGPQAERALRCVLALRDTLGLRSGAEIRVEHDIPAHVGLGSGTQLALAVGSAVSALHGLGLEARQIAALLDRGNRSGIGVGAFREGGFLVDGGRGSKGGIPPVVSRVPFPAEWRAILVFDRQVRGLHGPGELAAFKALPPFPEESADRLSRLTLMRMLPALVEDDLAAFGAAVSAVQTMVGDYFAAAQGGRFASPRVARALGALEARGAVGIGQSSWGPTGFAFVASDSAAVEITTAVRRAVDDPGLEFAVVRGRNRGAHISVAQSAAVCTPPPVTSSET